MATRIEVVMPNVALVGHPNVGKSTLFNRLSGGRVKTSNFAGTTVDLRTAKLDVHGETFHLVDVPGLNSLSAATPEQQIAVKYLRGDIDGRNGRPNVIVVVLDAMNLERSIFVAREVAQLGLPMIAALNMSDLAKSQGVHIDEGRLADRLGCTVVAVSAKNGAGIADLIQKIQESAHPTSAPQLPVLNDAPCETCGTCAYADGYRWAAAVADESANHLFTASHQFTESVDRVATNRFAGPAILLVVMFLLFASIFWLAQFPMEWIDAAFGGLSDFISSRLGSGLISQFLTGGLIAGVGSVLIFLPQICILFFGIALLEDSGYLSRAVVVVDKWMRFAGLPGQAFVPLLSAHACAIPAIMATRIITSRRDRLASILVIPLLTCSARLPVYSMVAAMLFPHQVIYATLLFVCAYLLGILAVFVTSVALRLTIIPGTAQSLIIDLPQYRTPSLRNAFRTAWHHGLAFVKGAGSVVLAISIGIWFLSTFPQMNDEQFAARVAVLESESPTRPIDFESDLLRASLAQEHSLLGRIGKVVQPAFAPLGFDWKTSVGVVASFAAREVVVSTLAVLHQTDEDSDSLVDRIAQAKNTDGSLVFDPPTSIALLVFFVLAMQCLPTQAVTKKETGRWSWAVFQFLYMTILAYLAAYAAKHVCHWLL